MQYFFYFSSKLYTNCLPLPFWTNQTILTTKKKNKSSEIFHIGLHIDSISVSRKILLTNGVLRNRVYFVSCYYKFVLEEILVRILFRTRICSPSELHFMTFLKLCHGSFICIFLAFSRRLQSTDN
jgi:hypothetical protein